MRSLVSWGDVTESDIAVIAGYKPQARELQEALGSSFTVEVGTVDAFQGRERKVVMVSLVRNNKTRAPGFWSDPRRLNVALTRSQEFCVVYGCVNFWAQTTDAFFELLTHLQQKGAILNADFTRRSTLVTHTIRNPLSRSAQEKKASSDAERIARGRACRVELELNESQITEFRKELHDCISAVLTDPAFEMFLPILMRMTVNDYPVANQPVDENQWDQKTWSNLCKITASGIYADAGNWVYSIIIGVMSQCMEGVPGEWRIAKFAGKSSHVTGDAKKMTDTAIVHIGDIYEALGGFVNWDRRESRRFCGKHNISEEIAKDFLSKLSSLAQIASILIGACDYSEWHCIVNFLLHNTPEWKPSKALWRGPAGAVESPVDARTLPKTAPHNTKRFQRSMPDFSEVKGNTCRFEKPRMVPVPVLKDGDNRFEAKARDRVIFVMESVVEL